MTEQYATALNAIVDPETRLKKDPLNMMELVLKFPAQCREASEIAWHYGSGRSTSHDVRNIVVTGLGGSAIGGDFLRVLADEYGPLPLQVNRDYTLPNWVGSSTLVIAGSYSGNTEETLAAYAAASAAAAPTAIVSSGGKLSELARLDGCAIATVPGGQPPRSATGYMFFPALNYLASRSFIRHNFDADMDETFAILEQQAAELGPEVEFDKNPAKQLAASLYGTIPVVYGTQGFRGVAAYRWKCQFNENTKIAAFSNVLPEQNHNEILAWVQAKKQAEKWSVIFLRDPAGIENGRIARRTQVTSEIIAPDATIHEVTSRGTSMLARLFSLVYMADFVSVYLAYLYNVCPTDIGHIDHLKKALA